MHRLLTCNRLLAAQNNRFKLHKVTFALPKIHYGVYSLRSQSTTTAKPEELAKKKRFRKSHYAKYVDLLEVTEATVNERKSRVKRLNAKKLDDFLINKQLPSASTETNFIGNALSQPIEYQKIDMEALEPVLLNSSIDEKPILFFRNEKISKTVITNQNNMESILKSFNNYREIIEFFESEHQNVDEVEYSSDYNLSNSKFPDIGVNHLDADVDSYAKPLKTAETKKIEVKAMSRSKSSFKSAKYSNEEFERLAKERATRINLKSYLGVCVSSGALNRALSTVLSYRQRFKRNKAPDRNIIDIKLYNILLHGFAEKGALDRLQYIFTLLEEDGISFNEQTYAATFECLGRMKPTEEVIETIKMYMKQSEKMGFTLNQIVDKSQFILDQRETVLKALQLVQADFVPKYTPPVLGYDNVLLNHFNDGILSAELDGEAKDKSWNTIKDPKFGYPKHELEKMANEQLKLELDGNITIQSIEKSTEFANSEHCREKLKELEALWRSQISSAITRDLNSLKAQIRYKPSGIMNYYTYLKALDTAEYTEILIKEVYKLAEGSETFSPTVGQLYRELGQKVQQRYQIEQKKTNGELEKMGDIYSMYCDASETPQTNENCRQVWQQLVHKARCTGPSMDIKMIAWPTNVLAGVGKFLYNILIRDIKIDSKIMRAKEKSKQQNILPAFYTLFRNQGRLVKEEVKPHPVLARLFRASRQQTLTFDSNLLPMLCPPQPWSTPFNGGYLLNKAELIRLPHQAHQQWERINNASVQSIYPALDSLNQLASIPWRVNTDILDIIIEVFQNGGNAKLDVPQPPTSLPPLPTIHKTDTSISAIERSTIFKETLKRRRRQAEMYSLWCDTLYRLSLANHYRDKVFWLPHNMDFRGRVYPVPPHLNHLGSDLARSMLIFDKARPLGPDGLSWLKLHCINLTGLKKRDSVRERLLYAEDVMSEILDSADNPLTGRMWWAKSDEPWQTLACCIEIAKVIRSGNIEGYMSQFPVHQDGSCNGLQHYAALGRDEAGACSVNLSPSTVPQDVYSSVATLVEKARKNDAENGLHVAQALEGFVRRKVIKQTVMTTVYGVTRYGARLQIARQLKDLSDFPQDWVWPASSYLTTKTFESLREMFTSTREIQDWFTNCARLISGVCFQNVEWVTPLGLPVVQPYTRQELKLNHTRAGNKISEVMSMDMYERPNILKQKNAFPPNFIHSLDSSHMMLTSLHCERKGLTFVSVHDCFWTHACTVPDMNKICRDQFVALHSQPILEDLSKFLQSRYDGKGTSKGNVYDGKMFDVLSQLPPKGDFDLRKVLDSVYFFS